jgi:hypothetical protein
MTVVAGAPSPSAPRPWARLWALIPGRPLRAAHIAVILFDPDNAKEGAARPTTE